MRTILILLAVLVPTTTLAQSTTITGPRGEYQGSVTSHSKTQAFTDQRGRFSGSSITDGNTTRFFDARGRCIRSSTQPQPKR
jgi:hypothetical protein